jgi:serine/threonine protein phosphatase PrpC
MLYGTAQVNGRGRRPPSTEDRISIELLMEGCDYFAVFDGHSGPEVGNLCKSELAGRLRNALISAGPGVLRNMDLVKQVLQRTFIDFNKYLASPAVFDTLDDSGSTATVALVTPTHIILAYLGDSPCFILDPATGHILSRMGKHEPSDAVEVARIQAAGGTVEVDEHGIPRVDGALAVSRAFGDFSLSMTGGKMDMAADWTKMKVTAHPDVMVWERPAQGILAIMSDGLVEGDTTLFKPLEEVSRVIYDGLVEHSNDLNATAKYVVQKHTKMHPRYDGDDLSLVLVNVGGGRVAHKGGKATVKPPTRKVKGRRRIRTEKTNRLIKIFSC